MKKIMFLLLLVLLLCVPTVLAETSTTVKDEWMMYYESFTHDGNEYVIRSANAHRDDPEDGLIVVKKNGELMAQVKYGMCERTEEFKYCFVNRTFNNSLVDIDSKGNLQPSIHVTLIEYSYADGLEISRNFEKTSLYLGETSEVTITIKNTGDFPFFNAEMNEPVPENFKILYHNSGLLKTGNNLFGTFSLYPGSEWSTTYTIQSLVYNASEKYATSLTYQPENRNETLTKFSGEATISVKNPYSYTASLNKNSLDINEKVKLTLTVKNLEDEEIEVKNLQIRVPSKMERVMKSNLKNSNNFLFESTSESINVDGSSIFTIDGSFSFAGSYEFIYSGDVVTKGYNYHFSGSLPFDVVTDGMSCSVLLNDSEIDSGESYNYHVLFNNNDDEMFYEVQGSTSRGDDVYIENIPKKSKNTELNISTKADSYFEKTAKNISFSGKYRTVNNQWFDLECEKIFDITPTKRVVSLNGTPQASDLDRGENTTISLTLTNLVSNPVNNIVISRGDWSKTINLDSAEQVTLDPISIIVPELFSESVFETEFIVEIPAQDYSDSLLVKIDVNNPYIASANQDNSNGSNTSSNSANTKNEEDDSEEELLIQEKKEDAPTGFFGKLKALLKSVFG